VLLGKEGEEPNRRCFAKTAGLSILNFMSYISYKMAKKANPSQRVCPYDIRKHNVLRIILRFDQMQILKP
jgi:hypothetical protein